LLKSAAPDFSTGIAIRAWNLMGGIDWAALPVIAELYGITDIDILIHQLVAIRDSQRETE
jgi:hypothetical protein